MSQRGLLPAIAALVLLLPALAGARRTDTRPPEGLAAPPAGAAPGEQSGGPAQETQSYSVFLPSAYAAERKWPVLFCFDPAQRGKLPIELFRDAAERIGMIIISADDFSSAGPTEDAVATMTAVWNDAMARYPLDPNRTYAAGFSGGGRVCWLLAHSVAGLRLAGIVEVGAGLPWAELPQDFDASNLAFCGLVGETDFNYYEVRRIEELLTQRGVPRRIVTFEGGHEWPSATECSAALEWLQVGGIRRGSAGTDSSLTARVFDAEAAAAKRDESDGRLIEARERLRSIRETFEGLRDLTAVSEALQRLERSREMAALLETRRRETEWASVALARAVAVLEDAILEGGDPLLYSSSSLRKEMGLDSILVKSASGRREERLAALRVLAGIHVRAAGTIHRELTRRGEFAAAAVVLDLAVAITPESPEDWRRLAAARSRAGMTAEAIGALREAVRLGLSDVESLKTDPAFDAIRADPEFGALLVRITDPR